MKDTLIFNPRKATNDHKRKRRTPKTTTTPSSATSSSSTSSISSKKAHHRTADAYAVMESLTWEYRQTHGLVLTGRERNTIIRCSVCDKTFKEGGTKFESQQHCGAGASSIKGETKVLGHKVNL